MPDLRSRIAKWPRRLPGVPLSNVKALEAKMESLPRKGAKVGRNVRLLGRLDELDPHLVTIGNSCVIGRHSALLTHCAIRGARPVTIEDYVRIGLGALILPGADIAAGERRGDDAPC